MHLDKTNKDYVPHKTAHTSESLVPNTITPTSTPSFFDCVESVDPPVPTCVHDHSSTITFFDPLTHTCVHERSSTTTSCDDPALLLFDCYKFAQHIPSSSS